MVAQLKLQSKMKWEGSSRQRVSYGCLPCGAKLDLSAQDKGGPEKAGRMGVGVDAHMTRMPA